MSGPATPAAPVFALTEQDLSARLGLSRKDIAEARARHLGRGIDWEIVKGRVSYSESARSRLMAALKIAEPDLPPRHSAPNTAQKNPAAPQPGDRRQLVCVRRCFPNVRLLEAQLGGAAQRVRVRDNKLFMPGMALECRFIQGNLWELAQRLPRWRGRW